MASEIKANTYNDFNSNPVIVSDGSGNVTIGSSGKTITAVGSGLANTPAFYAKTAAGQSISNATHTQIVFDTEVFDTDSAYASNTFTCPSGKAGKYFFFAQTGKQGWASNRFLIYLSKNGADASAAEGTSAGSYYPTTSTTAVIELSAGDTVKASIYQDGGTQTLSVGDRTTFYGYKLI